MVGITRDPLDLDNFVNFLPNRRRGDKPPVKNIRKPKRKKGVIETRVTNGQTYYYYRRGTDKPVYLGTAEKIYETMQNSIRRKQG